MKNKPRDNDGPVPADASRAAPTPVPRLCLLGAPHFIVAGNEQKLERKDALLLAWLALEGPTDRSRLATLLFPDAGEYGGRGSLRQRLFRARKTYADLLAGDDPLRIADSVDVD